MITREQYLLNPCGATSLPYWKARAVTVPEGMRIVHDREYDSESYLDYVDEPYFRLHHELREVKKPTLPAAFSLCQRELGEFASHINSCYKGICITKAELQGYMERPVYTPSLWLAVQEYRTGSLVATAIGEMDRELGEGVLEWVQVSENYRGQGLGSYLVRELLWRMKNMANFATVSGQCRNPSHPEQLYRRCGFTGHDVWHVLKKK